MMTLVALVLCSATVATGLEPQQNAEIENEYNDEMVLTNLHFIAGNNRQRRTERLAKDSWNRRLSRWLSPRNRMKRFWTHWESLNPSQQKRMILVHRIKSKLPSLGTVVLALLALSVLGPMIGLVGMTKTNDELQAKVDADMALKDRDHRLGLWMPESAALMAMMPTDILEHHLEMEDTDVRITNNLHRVVIHSETAVWGVTLSKRDYENKVVVTGMSLEADVGVSVQDWVYQTEEIGDRPQRHIELLPNAQLDKYGRDPIQEAKNHCNDLYGNIGNSDSARWRQIDGPVDISTKMTALNLMANQAISIIDSIMSTKEHDLSCFTSNYRDEPVTWTFSDWKTNGWEMSNDQQIGLLAVELSTRVKALDQAEGKTKAVNSHDSILRWILDQHGVESFDDLNANQVKLAVVAVQELIHQNHCVPITADNPSQWATKGNQGALDEWGDHVLYHEEWTQEGGDITLIRDPSKQETHLSKFTSWEYIDDSIKADMKWETLEDFKWDMEKASQWKDDNSRVKVEGTEGYLQGKCYYLNKPVFDALDEETFPAQLEDILGLRYVSLQLDTTGDKKGERVLAPFRRPRTHGKYDVEISPDKNGGTLGTGWQGSSLMSHLNRGDSKADKMHWIDRMMNYTKVIGDAKVKISETIAKMIPLMMTIKNSENDAKASPSSLGLKRSLKALESADMGALGQSLFPAHFDAESNLVDDESGAIDIVSVFTLIFLPLVMVIKAIYKLQQYSSCGSRESEEEIYSSKTKVIYNFKMEARNKGFVVMANAHFDGGSHPAYIAQSDLKYWYGDEETTHAEEILAITSAYNEVRLKHIRSTDDFSGNWSGSTYTSGAGIKAISHAHNQYWSAVDEMVDGDYSDQQIHAFVLDSKTSFRKAVSQFSAMLDEGTPTVMFGNRMDDSRDHRMLKNAGKAVRLGGQKDDVDERYHRSEESCAEVVKSAQEYIDLWQESILYDLGNIWSIWSVHESSFDDDHYGQGGCWTAAQIEARFEQDLGHHIKSKEALMKPVYMLDDDAGAVDLVSIMVLLFLPVIMIVKAVQIVLEHSQAVEVLLAYRMKHHQEIQDDNSLLFDINHMTSNFDMLKVLETAQKDSSTMESMRDGCKCTDCQFLYLRVKDDGGDVNGQTMQDRGLNQVMTAKVQGDRIVTQRLCEMHDCDEPIGVHDQWFHLDNDEVVCEDCFDQHGLLVQVKAVAGSGKTKLLRDVLAGEVKHATTEVSMIEMQDQFGFKFSDSPDWETALDDMKEQQQSFNTETDNDLINCWIRNIHESTEDVFFDMVDKEAFITDGNKYFVQCWIGLMSKPEMTARKVKVQLETARRNQWGNYIDTLELDEAGAVDLVSVMMLLFLPLIMVVKAVQYASALADQYSEMRHPAEAHRIDEDIPELLAFGGGVDSTAMVAIQCDRDAGFAVVNSILEAKGQQGWTSDEFDEMFPPVEHVVFANTGAEWDHTYANIEYAKVRLQEAGIPFTIVHNEYRGPIDDYIKERGIVPFFNGGKHTCSKIWKQKPMQDWSKETYGKDTVVRWAVGISYDETARMSKFNGLDKKALDQGQVSRFPMTDLMMTRYDEQLIIQEMNWSPDGDVVRLSACYHCPYNTEEDLRLLRNHNPALWTKAVEIEQAFFDNTNHQNWLDAGRPLNGRCNNLVDDKKCNTKPIAGQSDCLGCGQEYNGVRRAPHGMWADDYANRAEDPQRLIQRNGPTGSLMSMEEWGNYIDTGVTPAPEGQTTLFDTGCGGCSGKGLLFDDSASVSITGIYFALFFILCVPLIMVIKTVQLMHPILVKQSSDITSSEDSSFETCGGQSAPDVDGSTIQLHYAVPSTNCDGFPHSAEQAVGLNQLHDGFIHWAETGEPVCQIIEAVAGSGKTTYIKSVAKMMANLGLGSYRVILTAFNVHIAKDLNQVAIDIGPSLSGFVRMGGSNTVQAAGLSEILVPAGLQKGVDISVDGSKERNLARVVLSDAIGQYSEYNDLIEQGTADQPQNWTSAWYAHASALMDLVSSVKDDGLDPRLDSFTADFNDFLNRKSSILNWTESPLFTLKKSILIQMITRCIKEGQTLVFNAGTVLRPAKGAKSPNGERGYKRGVHTYTGGPYDKQVADRIKAVCPEPSKKGSGRRKVASNDAKRSGCKGTTKSMIEGGPVFDIKRIKAKMFDDDATVDEYLACEVNLPMFVRFSSYDAGNGNVSTAHQKHCSVNVDSTYQRNGGTSIRAAIGNFAKVGNNGNMQKANIGGIHRWKITDEKSARRAMALLALHFGTTAKGVYVNEAEVEESKDANPVGVVSFDDMTYSPFYYDLRPPQPAVLLCVDEVQDLSVLKGDMVRRFADESTNVLLVGDRRQALYLFAGADGAAMTKNAQAFNCEPLPMTICWRNSIKVGQNVHRMMAWATSVATSGEEPVDLSKTEVPAYADHRCPPVADWREGASSIRMPAHLVSQYIEAGDITCSRVVAPLARIAINTLREGKAVVLPAGNDGIDGLVKKIWTGSRPKYSGKGHAIKGLGLPQTDSPTSRDIAHDAPSQVSLTEIKKRVDDLLNYVRNKIIRDAGNDPKAVDKDNSYQNLVDETDCVMALAEGWLEQTGNINQSSRGSTTRADPALFLKWLDQFLGQTEGRNGEDSIRFASVHRVKGAQGKRTFIVMDRILKDKEGEERVVGAFMLPHCMTTPDEAVQELNAVYVASTRAIDQTVLVSHDKDLAEVFPTKESFDLVWQAANSGDDTLVAMAYKNATMPEADRVVAQPKVDHLECGSCDIPLDADADVDECVTEGCDSIMCKEYSGREASGPAGCSVPATFDDMINRTGNKICFKCSAKQREEALAKEAAEETPEDAIEAAVDPRAFTDETVTYKCDACSYEINPRVREDGTHSGGGRCPYRRTDGCNGHMQYVDESEPEEVIDIAKEMANAHFEMEVDATRLDNPNFNQGMTMQERMDKAMRDDESGAVDLVSLFMLMLFPIILVVNMAKKIVPAFTLAQREALSDEGPSYYMSDDDTKNRVINDRAAFNGKAGFFLACEACNESKFHNFTDSDKHPRLALQSRRTSNPFSRTRSCHIHCESCGGITKHHKQPKPPEWSPKSLVTIENMGTRPEQWGFAPVKFHKQKVESFDTCRNSPNSFSSSEQIVPVKGYDRSRYSRKHSICSNAITKHLIEKREERMTTKWTRDRNYNIVEDLQSCMGSGELVMTITDMNEEELWRRLHPMTNDKGRLLDKYIPKDEENTWSFRNKVEEEIEASFHIEPKNQSMTNRAILYHHYDQLDEVTHTEVIKCETKRAKQELKDGEWVVVEPAEYRPALIVYFKCNKCEGGDAEGYSVLKKKQVMNKRKVGFTADVGTIGIWSKTPLNVGVVQWPKDDQDKHLVRFDSRFSHHDCMVCGKPHIKSGLVPVMAKDDEEDWHAMWVGQDCAKKFMGFMKFTVPADACKKCNGPKSKGRLFKEVRPTPSMIDEQELSKEDVKAQVKVVWGCATCGNEGTHEEMVIEYDMETYVGKGHKVETVNSKDVGEKIRWVGLDGSLELNPQERVTPE